MRKDFRYIARILFQLKIYTFDGTTFEAFFTQIMQYQNPDFMQVKPQGKDGDEKCDGFDKNTGTFYQVYAPENITIREKEVIKKLETDFAGLYSHWKSITPIKRFYYVVNDKYKGVYPSLHQALIKIETANKPIEVRLLLAKDLEDIFLNLKKTAIEDLLGQTIPVSYNGNLEYGVMDNVVKYLLNIKTKPQTEFIPSNPDFNKKIIFNGLSETIESFLRSNRINEYAINDFFQYNSNYAKNELRNTFNSLYNEALKKLPDGPNKSDKVFMYIYNKAYSKHTMSIDTAIFTLMSYYFEYCDIFKAPEL